MSRPLLSMSFPSHYVCLPVADAMIGASVSQGVKNRSTMTGESGFGGLVVSMLASGSNPAEKNPQHAFLRRGSKAVCPMSQICGALRGFTWKSESQAKFTNRGLSCRMTWSASGDDGRN
jgi:hypothetical protein